MNTITANARRAFRSLIPPPRRPLRSADVAAPLVFATLATALIAWSTSHDRVLFTRPAAFSLLPVLPWIWWLHVAGYSGLTGIRAAMALAARLLLVLLFILALAEPRAVRSNDVLTVMYALDTSDSIGEAATDSALRFITRTAVEKPAKDQAGLLVFARQAAVELPPRLSFPFEAINTELTRDGTDLAAALGLAAAMIPDDQQGRVVLLSDGSQTQGVIGPVLRDLQARHIPVDVWPVAYAYPREVWLEKLELPRTVKTGETYEAAVVLSSLHAGRGRLRLTENGRTIAAQDVGFRRGKNRYELPLYLREPGYYEYVASIETAAADDGWEENNRAINHLYLKGKGRVLLVIDPDGDPRDHEPLTAALKQAKCLVEKRSAYQFPRSPFALLPYACIIFLNVPADLFDGVQMSALKSAVYDQGSGFIMVGGRNSFGPGGYHRTEIEETLPVKMDISQRKVLPKGALAIILHTCEFPEGNTWGKRITKKAIKVLGNKDEVGVLAYDYNGGEKWLFPLTAAGEYDKMARLINQATIGDMPSFAATMKLGLQGLQASDAAAKHMIVISDGDPSPPTPELVNQFVQAKISISMVAIFPHGGSDVPIMRSIAATTGGRYYYPQDPNLLPAIFIKEAKTLKRHMIQNRTFVPEAGFPSPVLKGIDTVPPLHGLVLTTAKRRARLVLQTADGEEAIDPVLAVWRFGTGKTAAFTSDLSANWGRDWVTWDRYRAFVKQLVTAVSRTTDRTTLQLYTATEGNAARVTVEDHGAEKTFRELHAAVRGPHGRTASLPLKQVAARRYEGSVPLWGKGRYHVIVEATGTATPERVTAGLAVAYSPEYLRFRSDPEMLTRIREGTGGRQLSGSETGSELFLHEDTPTRSSRPIVDWFLLALACLLPLDVGLRRVQIDLALVRSWFTRRATDGPAAATLGALLQRKRHIALPAAAAPVVTRRRPGTTGAAPATTAATGQSGKPAVPASPPPAAAAEEPRVTATTARLLARKRRRQQDDTDE